MCGIVGHVSRSPIDRASFDTLRDTLAHRGPDGAGSYFNAQQCVALGHRRLAILDLSDAGRQPMSNAGNTVHLTFNGEIYNYRELRAQLEGRYRFRTGTDTEVVLRAYEEWGLEKTLSALSGMFAFALYDQEARRLFCVRDRLGIKPLVYYSSGDDFLFASEIKSLLRATFVPRRLNYDAVYDFFMYRYVPHPRTIYRDIMKLEPGTWLELDVDTLRHTSHRYFDLVATRARRNGRQSETEVVQQTELLLSASVERMLHADVAVDTFLSGGLDSSVITAMAAEQRSSDVCAFSLRVASPAHDELDDATLVASSLNVRHLHDALDADRFRHNHREIRRAAGRHLDHSDVSPE